MKFESQLQIVTAAGVPPFTVNQAALVINLNADLLDGQHGSYYAAASSLGNYLPLTGGTLTGTLTGTIGIFTTVRTAELTSLLGSNGPITITPDGTGHVHINSTDIRLGPNNTNATLATRGTGDLILRTHEGSAVEGFIRIYDGANGNIEITPNGTGTVVVGKLSGSTASFSGQVTSTVATGTAPLVIASTTAVINLNSDLLDGQHGAYYENRDATALSFSGGTLTITRAAGNLTANLDGRYLLLSGGTLTGALSGTSASFSGALSITGLGTFANSAGNNYNENIRLPRGGSGYVAVALACDTTGAGSIAGQFNLIVYPSNVNQGALAIRANGTDSFTMTAGGAVNIPTLSGATASFSSTLGVSGLSTLSGGLNVSGSSYYTFNKPSPSNYQTVSLFGSTSGGIFITTDSGILSVGTYYNNGWISTAASGTLLNFAGGEFDFQTFSGATVPNAPALASRFRVSPSLTRAFTNLQTDGAITVLGGAAITGAITQGGNQVLHAGNFIGTYLVPETTYTTAADASGYVWIRIPTDGFNSGAQQIEFYVSRAIFDNSSSPYGGCTAKFTLQSREWHSGQEMLTVQYGEHGANNSAGAAYYLTHARVADQAGSGYWVYLRLRTGTSTGITYKFRESSVGSTLLNLGGIQATTDPGSASPIFYGFNLISTGGSARFYRDGNQALDAGNFSAYALPLTGGTISGNITLNGHLTSGAGYQVRWSDGSAASPGYSFYADTDTGIHRPADNSLSIVTGGAIRVTVDSSGNTGLGGTPYFRLQSYGVICASDPTYNGSGGTGGTLIAALLNNDNTAPGLDLRRWTGSAGIHGTTYISTDSTGATFFYNGQQSTNIKASVLKMTLDASGNLTPIGTVTGTRLISSIATGTAPLSITSTTLVSNLNSDLLDGQHGSYFENRDTTAVGFSGGTLTLTRAAGNLTVGLDGRYLPLTGGALTGTISIDTSGSTGSTSTVIIKRSGQSAINFGSYGGAWRSALQIQSNGNDRMLFFVPPETGYETGIFRVVNGGLSIDVGGTTSTTGVQAIAINSAGSVAIPVGLSVTATVNALNFSGPGTGLTGTATGLTAGAVPWTGVTGKPTTLSGYGITDALSLSGGTVNGNLTINGTTLVAPGVIAVNSLADGYIGFGDPTHTVGWGVSQGIAGRTGDAIWAFGSNGSTGNTDTWYFGIGSASGGTFATSFRITQNGKVTFNSGLDVAGGALTALGNQVLHAGNYTTLVNGTLLRAAGHPGYGDWNTFGNATQTVNSIFQENFNIPTSTGSSNFPTEASYRYGLLLNIGTGSDARAQVYISHAGNDLIFRGGWGASSWQAWNKCLTNQNYSSYALPLSGGTLTGALAGTSASFSGALTSGGNSVLTVGNYSSYAVDNTKRMKQFFWDNLSASTTQARRFEIARIGIDQVNWNQVGSMEIEVSEDYYDRGLKKKYVVWYGYNTTRSGVVLTEMSGAGTNSVQVTIGSETPVTGNQYYLPVYVDVKYYGIVSVRMSTSRQITSNSTPPVGYTYINPSPTPTNIADFTPDSTVNISNAASAWQVGGNVIIHAGNYTSYPPARWATGRTISLTGDVTGTSGLFDGTASISFAATIANSSVTYAKIQNVAVSSVLGNSSASVAQAPQALSMATLASLLSGQTMNIVGSSTSCSGNAATATNLSTNRTNWWTSGVISAVVGQLGWKHYNNNHTIFDASNSTAPDGSAINNTNAQVAWSSTYPTLMGWNGANTYGVRVDSARVADSAASATSATSATTATNSTQLNGQAASYYENRDTTSVSISAGTLTLGRSAGNLTTTLGGRTVAWCEFNGNFASSQTPNASFNVSSITKNATGDYTINFSSALANTNYVVAGYAQLDTTNNSSNYNLSIGVARRSGAKATGSCRIGCEYLGNATLYDSGSVGVAFIAA